MEQTQNPHNGAVINNLSTKQKGTAGDYMHFTGTQSAPLFFVVDNPYKPPILSWR